MSTQEMEIADVWVKFDDKGSNIPKFAVTPAEAMFLNKVRQKGEDDTEVRIIHIANVRTTTRTNIEEKQRLSSKYGEREDQGNRKKVDIIFPGANPPIPRTFAEAGFEVDNQQPKSNPKPFEYPNIVTLEPVYKRKDEAQAELNAEVDKLKELVAQQSKQIATLIEKAS